MTDAFKDNQSNQRLELEFNEKTVYADYRREGDDLYITYVYAPPELRGSGAANALMKEIVRFSEKEGLKIVPICGYAKQWMERFAK